eukprot:764466-Hanusia_phi.AAC.8
MLQQVEAVDRFFGDIITVATVKEVKGDEVGGLSCSHQELTRWERSSSGSMAGQTPTTTGARSTMATSSLRARA